jgi:DNA mismatch endonuclease (patch repair protein)
MRAPTPEVSARMRLVKTSRTKPEVETARTLRALRLKFRRNVRSLPGTPDFVLPDHGVAIFVHGCFWHGCPRCFRGTKRNAAWWREKVRRNRLRDQRKARELRALGFHVVQLWEHDSRDRVSLRVTTATRRTSAARRQRPARRQRR